MSLINNILRWARITKPGSDDKQFATQQMEYLGKVGDGLVIFPYGLHGNVPADSLALMFAVQGNSDNRAAIAWTPKNRPKLKGGEVAFYHPPTDALIKWDESGNLNIITGKNGSGIVNVTASTINMTGNVNITGDIAVVGTMTNNGKDVGDTHGHAQDSDSGGNAEALINGVT